MADAVLGIVLMLVVLGGFVGTLMLLPELERRYRAKREAEKKLRSDAPEGNSDGNGNA